MTEFVTSGSVGGMASNGCFYPESSIDSKYFVNFCCFMLSGNCPKRDDLFYIQWVSYALLVGFGRSELLDLGIELNAMIQGAIR